MSRFFNYKAQVISVYDGDSFRANVDVGFNIIKRNIPFRLARIDTPEIRGDERPEGLVAEERTRELIENEEVIIHSTEKGKYGRWIVEVYFHENEEILLEEDSIEEMTNLNDLLVEEGLAEYVYYD